MDDLGVLTASDRKPNQTDLSQKGMIVIYMNEKAKDRIASDMARSRCSNDVP